jgi:hypothetical protein
MKQKEIRYLTGFECTGDDLIGRAISLQRSVKKKSERVSSPPACIARTMLRSCQLIVQTEQGWSIHDGDLCSPTGQTVAIDGVHQ